MRWAVQEQHEHPMQEGKQTQAGFRGRREQSLHSGRCVLSSDKAFIALTADLLISFWLPQNGLFPLEKEAEGPGEQLGKMRRKALLLFGCKLQSTPAAEEAWLDLL